MLADFANIDQVNSTCDWNQQRFVIGVPVTGFPANVEEQYSAM